MQLLGFFFVLLGFVGGEFRIDYENNTFLMDGKPFRYVSGSMHYFRCPRAYWRDRLRKMKEAGLNAVSTYVEWSQHEKVPGIYDFTGDLDLKEFISTAEQEGLYVILRPGPYICAERDMGGLPPWLLKNPDIRLRTSDPRYTGPVQRWMDLLLEQLSPLLHGNGGPIILIQVENEYGSYPACDKTYLLWLRDLLLRHTEEKAVLFTTDGAGTSYLKCGKIPGVYASVDFGPGTDVNAAFKAQRAYEPKGPLINSEYYPGWLTHWGEARAVVSPNPVADTLRVQLSKGANVNFYMFHGGTNFGFTAGANLGAKYQSDITSYDYDAPITEAGDLTEKYHMIKSVISEFFPPTNKSTSPDISPKGNYGELRLANIGSLLNPTVRGILGKSVRTTYPTSFEVLDNPYGYVAYETNIGESGKESRVLKAPSLRDHGIVLVNGQRVATLSRENGQYNASLSQPSTAKLTVLVENMGRINYGAYNNDSKGLGNVILDNQLLTDWTMTSFPLDSVKDILNCPAACLSPGGLRFFAARFLLPEDSSNDQPLETFLDVSSLAKGLVFINDNNLGRYWSQRGPQLSLYVPGVWLKKSPEENVIVVMDEVSTANSIKIRFSASPIWNARVRSPKVTLV